MTGGLGSKPLGSAAPTFTPPAGSVVAGLGDFNNDGFTDWVIRDVVTGDTRIALLGREAKYLTYTPATFRLTGADWKILGIGDFVKQVQGSADTKWPEILWYNKLSNQLVMWHLDSKYNVDKVINVPSTPDLNWRAQIAADLTGDGHYQIVWRNRNGNGSNIAWNLDDAGNPISSSSLPSVPDTLDATGEPNWQVRCVTKGGEHVCDHKSGQPKSLSGCGLIKGAQATLGGCTVAVALASTEVCAGLLVETGPGEVLCLTPVGACALGALAGYVAAGLSSLVCKDEKNHVVKTTVRRSGGCVASCVVSCGNPPQYYGKFTGEGADCPTAQNNALPESVKKLNCQRSCVYYAASL
jgi:hypothetical protein